MALFYPQQPQQPPAMLQQRNQQADALQWPQPPPQQQPPSSMSPFTMYQMSKTFGPNRFDKAYGLPKGTFGADGFTKSGGYTGFDQGGTGGSLFSTPFGESGAGSISGGGGADTLAGGAGGDALAGSGGGGMWSSAGSAGSVGAMILATLLAQKGRDETFGEGGSTGGNIFDMFMPSVMSNLEEGNWGNLAGQALGLNPITTWLFPSKGKSEGSLLF